VRSLLAASKTAAALRALDQYAREFPSGVLQQEATLLRLESLVQSKRTARARELASQFLREHPESPHRDRIRALLDDAHVR
jgi:outer membrane protein assembly factor BamD (BamD/ComL family)